MTGTFLHRHLWQHLPRSARRRALFGVTQHFAPAIDETALPQEPIIVAGVLRSTTGLGQSARLAYAALRASGRRVFAIDLTKGLRQREDLTAVDFEDGRHLIGAGTLLLHVNSPLVPMALFLLGRQFVRRKWVVGYWAWELPGAPAEWRSGLSRVHDIWAPSRFTAHALAGLGRPVRVVPHAVAAGFSPPARKASNAGAPVVLLQFDMTSSFARKNPLAAIAAFKAAYGADPKARLLVKTRETDAYPQGRRLLAESLADLPNIEFIEKALSKDEHDQLYAQVDAIISLHRSEGFGLTVAQGMLAGLPVVATDWSGTTDFVDAQTGLPVAYDLVPARDPQGEYDHPQWKWAEARISDAAAKLESLRDVELRSRIGETARREATKLFSAAAYTGEVERILGDAAPQGRNPADPSRPRAADLPII